VDREAVAAIATLSDPTRAAVFEEAQAAQRPVTREAVAEAVGISRKLAAFHLDRLVAAGLLQADTAPSRKVGRAPKTYRPSERHVQVSVPPRRHEPLAEILLSALTDTAGSQDSAISAVTRTASDRGHAAGAEFAGARRLGRLGPERAMTVLTDLLNQHGYLACTEQQTVRLRNCPFQPLAAENPALICALNHGFISGLIDGLEARGIDAVLRPDPAGCCVQVHRSGTVANRAGSPADDRPGDPVSPRTT
jgi:predicted ArsR family transcriptional regulator